MRKTESIYFIKKPIKWELVHLIDMINVYREYGEKIRIFKDLESNSFILIYSVYTVRYNNLRDLCELLWPYYNSLMKKKKSLFIEEYFNKKFMEDLNNGKFELSC